MNRQRPPYQKGYVNIFPTGYVNIFPKVTLQSNLENILKIGLKCHLQEELKSVRQDEVEKQVTTILSVDFRTRPPTQPKNEAKLVLSTLTCSPAHC
jgi:hypothetical protein